ncbi:deoxyribose-phosphate aldolase [Neisseria leonii]|uniref:Deoxyribose-phosphate aldolase n=1 Tax=Neisseria leonii TaxID=2995413 RepID=A0A9X4IDR8_9NEIS|nr:deoxyribose-phosphate aldolase [Neisseria sp. 51.81]MDD9327418.1 deoxyribose-phosphate aldolase [Neisseria sp. 51.81]
MDKAKLFSLIDLTSLNDDDTPDRIAALCAKAVSPAFGNVAAVCVYPPFVAQARKLCPPDVAVATVVNFPSGNEPKETVLHQTQTALNDGAAEIDVVFPYRQDSGYAQSLCAAVAELSHAHGAKVKVILETGESDEEQIRRNALTAIAAGADFLKTSTGKTANGASPEAVAVLCGVIAGQAAPAGLKISGGIRTAEQADAYLQQVKDILGGDFIRPQTFRFGASALLDELLK